LDAPDLKDDFFINTICWNKNNVLAVALGQTLFSWHSSYDGGNEVLSLPEPFGYISAVSFSADAPQLLSIGTSKGIVLVQDVETKTILRLAYQPDEIRVGTIAWNRNTFTTGSADSKIWQYDIRVNAGAVVDYSGGHRLEISGLKWDDSGRFLASGSGCDTVCIWDSAMPRDNQNVVNPLTTFHGHTASIKAIDWCPSRRGILASGGGLGDRTIKVWDCNTGVVKSTTHTGNQVSGLYWSRNDDGVLLSSHGFNIGHMNLWSVQNDWGLEKLKKIPGCGGRISYLAVSPDEKTVATAGSDEHLALWQVFERRSTPNAFGLLNNPTFGVPQIR
jgi:cell division cycle 20, cofactor of APC complex